ncbi:complex I NDUFA9 subunit family protein [Granulosicoccus sp. 3-233]|uniref:complex I NDUFA9 subunit family protein n=1 Tax=Granulosicoccus sp. 3-233 TaxID=3417969 RepID=UPI003D342853
MSSRRVTLLGGSGFVGSQLTYRLATKFDEVVVLTRRAQRVRTLRTMSNVHAQEVDVHDAEALTAALAGSDTVINLIGILNEGGSQSRGSFSSAHSELTGKVLNACAAGEVRHYLHMSALNADADKGSSEYLRTKGEAEQRVRAHTGNTTWTIFQPSIIFGEHDAFFNRFAGLLRALPVFPLAVPDARMAPVFIGDVCDVMIAAIDDPQAAGSTIQLCGPQDYTLRELVQYTADTAGLSRTIIGLPDWAARLQARIMEFVPGKPFSRDNYLSLQTPSVCDSDCARQPTSLDAVVPRYLGKRDWAGRLQQNRAAARR